MKFIIVIKGVDEEMYEGITRDITTQCKIAGYPIPIFAYLPSYTEEAIEIVWTDPEMELKHLEMISKQLGIANTCTCSEPKEDVQAIKWDKVYGANKGINRI